MPARRARAHRDRGCGHGGGSTRDRSLGSCTPGRQAQHPEHYPLHRKRRFGVLGCVLDAPGPVARRGPRCRAVRRPARRRPCSRSRRPRGRERYLGTSCRSSMPLSTSATPNGMTTAHRTWNQNGMIPGLPRSWWHPSLRAVNSADTSAQFPHAAEPARRPASQRTSDVRPAPGGPPGWWPQLPRCATTTPSCMLAGAPGPIPRQINHPNNVYVHPPGAALSKRQLYRSSRPAPEPARWVITDSELASGRAARAMAGLPSAGRRSDPPFGDVLGNVDGFEMLNSAGTGYASHRAVLTRRAARQRPLQPPRIGAHLQSVEPNPDVGG